VDVIRILDQVRLATTSSDADGTYAVTVPTHNAPVDTYLDVRHPGHLRTRAYPVPQLTSDSRADVIVFSNATLQDCAAAAGVSQPSSTAFILAQLFESNQPAPGATAEVTPSGRVRYTDPSTSKPGGTQGATDEDGLVWIFAVQPDTASVSGQLADGVPVYTREVHVEPNLVIEIGLEPAPGTFVAIP
jgi:hypothetical protein